MKYVYPMMADLTSHRCLVVGGGAVAERKIGSLLAGNADVIVVSPQVTDKIKSWAQMGKIIWIPRLYQEKDGENCLIVIAATNDPDVNKQIYHDARRRKQFINVVDQPALCNFIVPSTVRRGKLTLAISTHGASPSLAKQIRKELEERYSEEYALLLELVHEMRVHIQKRVPDQEKRRKMMKELISPKWINICRLHPNQAKEWMLQWIEQEIQSQC
ncbi:precorrin-2 dehydrogenase/sirohydrochlorin ferrochelatase family protein [Thermoflavimicrobium dichotomicum]|uniref:precorrin-2 dehydrogenase n=1 Tax=Thermoflavimicrobium dichotomicum TaxID=46223 RepID=A0A1I3RAT8_9BACL|nr:bifunctional precorrin-2 dehydrogenase/sirohydrochlorin ferrochelatase [Thermoflavimicrobium dichotomicum]SFJ42437.1 precorrin-2 dehydrogenase / sirohydrochlorin ferrochelatase [Thermoflavimicrobium dichotomicum]